jgi:micrococcal nuclease
MAAYLLVSKKKLFERSFSMNFKNYFVLYFFIFSLFISSCVNVDFYNSYDYIDSASIIQSLEEVEVSSVTDGDTFNIYSNGSTVKIRIIGIDTPEIHEGSKPVGEYGFDASNYLKDFVSKYEIYIKRMGYDNYGRILAYVFGRTDDDKFIFYESSILNEGLARPLIYFDNDDSYLTPKLIDAYNSAFENKIGIFSKWDTAPVLTSSNNFQNYIGKIVFLNGTVQGVGHDGSKSEYYINSSWFIIKIRDPEYYYFFKNYNLYDLIGKNVKFYGELWQDEDTGKPMILLRSPNEIVIN